MFKWSKLLAIHALNRLNAAETINVELTNMPYKDLAPPAGGKISNQNGKIHVPDNPVLPFIRGDGTGPDIWAASQSVFDAAVQKAYGGKRKIAWLEVFAGEKAFNRSMPS